MSNLHKKFTEAGLRVIVPKKPMRETNEDIFQMDVTREFVHRERKRLEHFRIWKGHEDNRVIVLNTDKKLKQLLLMVDEPERFFEVPIGHREMLQVKNLASSEKITLREAFKKIVKSRKHLSGEIGTCTQSKMTIKQRTPGNKRHYLCGVDERQLFISELPKGASSVKQAHEELKGSVVRTAEGRAPGRTQRQGEWFLLNCTPEETRRINEALRSKLSAVRILKGRGIGSGIIPTGGTPHIAAEQLSLPAPELEHGFSTNARPDVFVRGKITHPDHRPLKFKRWRKVLLNNEARVTAGPAMRGRNGVYWVD